MTRDEFVSKAVRKAERRLGLPEGWWGTYERVHAPNGHASVRWSPIGRWRIYGLTGAFISTHDSRAYAVKKLVRLIDEPRFDRPFPGPQRRKPRK